MCIGVEYKVMEAMKTIKIVNHGKHIACNHVPLNLHICLSIYLDWRKQAQKRKVRYYSTFIHAYKRNAKHIETLQSTSNNQNVI